MVNFLIFIVAFIALVLLVLGSVFIRRYINLHRQSLAVPDRLHLRPRNRPLTSSIHTRGIRDAEAVFGEVQTEGDVMGRLSFHEWPIVESSRSPMNSMRSASHGESYTSLLVVVPGEDDHPHHRHFRTVRSSQGQRQADNEVSAMYIPNPTHHAIAGLVLARNTDEEAEEEYKKFPFATIVVSSKQELEECKEQCRAQCAEHQPARRAWRKRDLRRAKTSRRPTSAPVFKSNESRRDTGWPSKNSPLYRLHSSSSSTISFLTSSRSSESSVHYLRRVPGASSSDAASSLPYRLQPQSFHSCASSSYSSSSSLVENDEPITEKEETRGGGGGGVKIHHQQHQKGGKVHARNNTARGRSGGEGREGEQVEKGARRISYDLTMRRGPEHSSFRASEKNSSSMVADRKEAYRKHSSLQGVVELSSSFATAVNVSEEAAVLGTGGGTPLDPTTLPNSASASARRPPITTHTTPCSAGGESTVPFVVQEALRPFATIEEKKKAKQKRKKSTEHDSAEEEYSRNVKHGEKVDSKPQTWTSGIGSVSPSSFSPSISSCPPDSLMHDPSSSTAPPLTSMAPASSWQKELSPRKAPPLLSLVLSSPLRPVEDNRPSPISRPPRSLVPSLEPPSLLVERSDLRSMTPLFLDWDGMGGGEGTPPNSGETCLLTLYQPPSLERKTVAIGGGGESEDQGTKGEAAWRRSTRTTSLSTPKKRISPTHTVSLQLPETDKEEQMSTLSGAGLTDNFTNSTRSPSPCPLRRQSPSSCAVEGGGGVPFPFQKNSTIPSLLRVSLSTSSLLSSPSITTHEKGEKRAVKGSGGGGGGGSQSSAGGRDGQQKSGLEDVIEKKKGETEETLVPHMVGKSLRLSPSIRQLSSSASPPPFPVIKGKTGDEHTPVLHPLRYSE